MRWSECRRKIGIPGPCGKAGAGLRWAGPTQLSGEPGRFEIVVGLDDFDQPVLCRPVAAVAVRMVALYEVVKLGLDLNARGADLQSQRVEGLALGIADGAALGCGVRLGGRAAPGEFAIHAQRID